MGAGTSTTNVWVIGDDECIVIDAAHDAARAAYVPALDAVFTAGGCRMTGADPNAVQLVLRYVEASQRARASGDPADFADLREYLVEDLVIKQASAWTDTPWRVLHEGRETLLARLQAPANAAVVLHTETVNAVAAGNEVLVEQVSTITTTGGAHVSAVCFMFSVSGGKITGGRLYRNDANLPVG